MFCILALTQLTFNQHRDAKTFVADLAGAGVRLSLLLVDYSVEKGRT